MICSSNACCPCKGALLVLLGLLGLAAYFNVYALPYLEIIWPVLAVVLGLMVFKGICCHCCTKK